MHSIFQEVVYGICSESLFDLLEALRCASSFVFFLRQELKFYLVVLAILVLNLLTASDAAELASLHHYADSSRELLGLLHGMCGE